MGQQFDIIEQVRVEFDKNGILVYTQTVIAEEDANGQGSKARSNSFKRKNKSKLCIYNQ